MTTKHRNNIVREARKNIAAELKDYGNKHISEQENILDRYIEKSCIIRGFTINQFYFEEVEVLDKILGR